MELMKGMYEKCIVDVCWWGMVQMIWLERRWPNNWGYLSNSWGIRRKKLNIWSIQWVHVHLCLVDGFKEDFLKDVHYYTMIACQKVMKLGRIMEQKQVQKMLLQMVSSSINFLSRLILHSFLKIQELSGITIRYHTSS